MSSTFGGLNTVVRGLFAQQMSLDTVGHNISNANTDGYSRQRVNLVTSNPQTLYAGIGQVQLGTGVVTESITRARDTFVDQQMWKESSTLGYGQTLQDSLGKIEGVFMEPTETGMQTVLNKFWEALNTLSTNGSDNGARSALRERGVELVDTIQQANKQLRNMVSDMNSVVGLRVETINQITSEMVSLNKQITAVEVGKIDHANDLRDRRDYLVDQLSSIINVRVTEDQVGNYIVQSSGVLLVDGQSNYKLSTKSSIDPDYNYEVVSVTESTGVTINFTDGELKGLLASRDDQTSGVKGYLDKLSNMSQFLLQEFNAVQRSGYGSDNSTGYNFFGVSGNASTSDYSVTGNYAAIFGTTTPKSYQWIDSLKVNDDLFNPVDGTAKIAAKTMAGSVQITQSNAAGGKIAFGGKYTGSLASVSYQVRLTANTAGAITGIEYSTDNGTSWNTSIEVTPATTPKTFSIGNGVTVQIGTQASNANGDTYNFSMPQGIAAGDNAVNLANRLKVDISELLGKSSLDTFYASFIGALGIQRQSATRLTDNQKALVSQITNSRESVSGVNMDEEMSNMIRFQKGYNAAARILTSMDEMLDKLINGTGVVGR
ncbi:flagellar hook-associated protein FlgK [Sporomusa malonica]|uniref:Flagellar hook-associated protein 1 n=1 Tax=Sporomusa malonica TaxID=112901 RepID=A0A1W1YUH0_9FIRM|nr:flagellar hook-associated protein FlgK [Sporomusa malonica]SMC39827.1 flagellar hook-associated protein 1 FlgK [Sporomusa malonica]